MADGSVEGQYWKKKSEIGKASKLVTFTTHYVGSDSLAELMDEHPKTTYIVNTKDVYKRQTSIVRAASA